MNEAENSNIKIPGEWKELLNREFSQPYFKELSSRVREEYLTKTVFPPPKELFKAFEMCTPDSVRVVILGQDPYHTPGVAHGLAFSTNQHNEIPPSLQNIFKEIEQEYGFVIKNPDLTRWATQGVLLLNASLTVRAGLANSHSQYGWHLFTDAVIRTLSQHEENIVFMLWGAYAQQKRALIDEGKHLVLTSVHPSPLSAYKGFFGNNHFMLANEYLHLHKRKKIIWV